MSRSLNQQSAQTLWRTISTNLMGAEPRAVLFVSGEGGEGEAEAALLACRAASQEGFEVCLIVTDVGKGATAALLRGIGTGEAARTISVAGHTLTVEKGKPGEPDILRLELQGELLRGMIAEPAEGSNTGDLRDQLLMRLNELYEITVVVGGSVLADPYSLIFSNRVPGVVLVLRSGRARLNDVGRAKSLIEASGGSILGSVMTNRKAYLPAWLERRL